MYWRKIFVTAACVHIQKKLESCGTPLSSSPVQLKGGAATTDDADKNRFDSSTVYLSPSFISFFLSLLLFSFYCHSLFAEIGTRSGKKVDSEGFLGEFLNLILTLNVGQVRYTRYTKGPRQFIDTGVV